MAVLGRGSEGAKLNLLEKLTTCLASWLTHLAIRQEFTWEKSDFLC